MAVHIVYMPRSHEAAPEAEISRHYLKECEEASHDAGGARRADRDDTSSIQRMEAGCNRCRRRFSRARVGAHTSRGAILDQPPPKDDGPK